MNHRHIWTEIDDQWLRDHYKEDARDLAKHLGRTVSAIYHRVSRLGLPRPSQRCIDADPNTIRRCRYCKNEYPLQDFISCRGTYTWKCRKCDNAYQRQWAKANPERVRAQNRKYQYGLERDAQLKVIGSGECHICHNAGEEIDHDHRTGQVRGYLCKHCNRGLGHFRDDIEIMQQAVNYLEESQCSAPVS